MWQPGRLLETPHVFCETVDNASDASGLNYVHYVVLKWTLIKKNATDGSLLELKTPLVFVVDQKRKNETDWRTILKVISAGFHRKRFYSKMTPIICTDNPWLATRNSHQLPQYIPMADHCS